MRQINKNTNLLIAFLKALATVVLGISIVFALTGFSDNPQNYELKTETYIVQRGDTLNKIAFEYMKKNTYGNRGLDEFKQGIIEVNVNKYPDIKYSYIYVGDKLQINYWIRKE